MTLKESKLYPNFQTNEDGTIVYNSKLKKFYTPYLSNSGYMFAAGIPIHRIVASAYMHDKYFKEATVDHINGNKIDNRVENLEWVTQTENSLRSYRNGRTPAWSGKSAEYPTDGRKKQAKKISGKNNPAAVKRIMIIKSSNDRVVCYTRDEILRAIEEKFGVKRSLSYLKNIIKLGEDKNLGYSLIKGQSTIERS